MGDLLALPTRDNHAVIGTLSHLGVDEEPWLRINTDRSFANRVARFIQEGAPARAITLERARTIMPGRIFGSDEWTKHFEVALSPEEQADEANFPWGEDVLDAIDPTSVAKEVIGETHFAFFGCRDIGGFPLTIEEWTRIAGHRFYHADWKTDMTNSFLRYAKNHGVSRQTCEPRWYLMPLQMPIVDSDRGWKGIEKNLPAQYRAASAVELITMIMLAAQLGDSNELDRIRHWNRMIVCFDRVGRGRLVVQWSGHELTLSDQGSYCWPTSSRVAVERI